MNDNPFRPMHAEESPQNDAASLRAKEEEQKQAEAVLDEAIDQVLQSDDPEQSLEELLTQLPPEMHQLMRKRFNKKRMKQEAAQDGGLSIRDLYQQLKQKLARLLAPSVLQQVKSIGLDLNARGITLNSVENISQGRIGQLAPPSVSAVSQEQVKETER